jgi:hypothetical protein
MCEYCGCQALPPIDELTREHELVLSLISQVGSARADGDLPRMADLAQQIAVVLGPHTLVEEQGLFPRWRPSSRTRSPFWRPSTGASTPCLPRRQSALPRIRRGQTGWQYYAGTSSKSKTG